MSLSLMVSPQHRVETMCASRTLTALSARSVSTGLAAARVSISHPLTWLGTTVQKTPKLSSGQLVRRYANYSKRVRDITWPVISWEKHEYLLPTRPMLGVMEGCVL